jgi:hypothetical protein
VALLEQERLTAPGQLVFEDADLEIKIWVGDQTSLEPKWCTQTDITDILYMPWNHKIPGYVIMMMVIGVYDRDGE